MSINTETHHPLKPDLKLEGANREGFAVYSNGDTYEGFLRNEKRNGFGILVRKCLRNF
jgi:hypothetical protein